jgi:hypothetical protein
MRKLFTLLAFVGILSLQSCTITDDLYIEDTTVSEVFEVPTSFTASNNYSKQIIFNSKLFASDEVLVYRLIGSNQGKNIWKLLPEAHYFNDGSFDFGYEYDYSLRDVTVYLVGDNLNTVPTSFRLNQILQVVIVPGSFAKLINKNDYFNVMSTLKLNQTDIKTIIL